MVEYIEREAVLKEVYRIGNHPWSEWETAGVVSLVSKQPNIEVEPVKHGRWLQPKTGECFCSECQTNGSPQWKRCPVCEVKMDGGDAE